MLYPVERCVHYWQSSYEGRTKNAIVFCVVKTIHLFNRNLLSQILYLNVTISCASFR